MWSGLAVVFGVRLVFEMEVVCQLLFRLLSSLLARLESSLSGKAPSAT
jgi:hypothetical protein